MSVHEEFVRRLYVAWNERGPHGMAPEFWGPDVVWHDVPDMPDRADHYGATATARYLDSVIEALGHMRVDVLSVEDTENGAIAELSMAIEGQLSGVASELHLFHVLQIVDGSVTEVSVFTDRESARAAAGLDA
jgi:ketosteroid isomerase-like protein